MTKLLSTLLFFFLCLPTPYAQVAINTTKKAADPSALLDLSSTTKGALVPRMTSTQRLAIKNPAAGLLVFDTDEKTLYMFDSQFWLGFAALSDSKRPANNFNYGPDASQDTTMAGYSVSIWDQFVAIGAPVKRTDGIYAGCVYIYRNVAGTWQYFTTLHPTGNTQGSKFGLSVSLRGNYLVVGAPNQANALDVQVGAIYIYGFNGSDWILSQNIYGSTGGSSFGNIVSVNQLGTYVAVSETGATVSGLANAGVVKIYYRSGKLFSLQATIEDPAPVADEQFGAAMAMSALGNYIAVGAPNKAIGGKYAVGYVGLFERSGLSWPQTHTAAQVMESYRQLGTHVDVTEGHIIYTTAKTKELTYLTLGWGGYTVSYPEDIHGVTIDPVTDRFSVLSGSSLYYSPGGANTSIAKNFAADNIVTLPNVLSFYNQNFVVGISQAVNVDKPLKGAFYFGKLTQ